MRKTDYMSKWKLGMGSAFLMVMLAGCGSGMQDLATGAGDVSLVSSDATDASSNQSRDQELSSGTSTLDVSTNVDQEQQTSHELTQRSEME